MNPILSKERIALALFFLMALAVWMPGLILTQPWHDEIYTLKIVHQGPMDILEALKQDSGPPLYYLATWAWTSLTGEGIIQVRFFCLLCSLGFIIYLLRSGVKPYAWYLVHPLVVVYAGEGRNYALFFLLLAASTYYIEKKKWIPAALTVAAALYTHNYALLFIPVWIILKPRMYSAVITGLVLYLPWLPTMLNQPHRSILWMEEYARTAGGFEFTLTPIAALFGMVAPGIFVRWRDLTTLFLVAALILMVWITIRQFKTIWVHLLCVFLPLILVLCYSSTVSFIYFPGRTEAVVLPLFLLLVGRILMAQPARLQSLVSTMLFLFSLIASTQWTSEQIVHRHRGESSFREIADEIIPYVKNDDVVVFSGYSRLEVNYYLKKHGLSIQDEQYPLSEGPHPGWLDLTSYRPSDWEKEKTVLEEQVTRWRGMGKRVFFLETPHPPDTLPVDLLNRSDVLLKKEGFTFYQFRS